MQTTEQSRRADRQTIAILYSTYQSNLRHYITLALRVSIATDAPNVIAFCFIFIWFVSFVQAISLKVISCTKKSFVSIEISICATKTHADERWILWFVYIRCFVNDIKWSTLFNLFTLNYYWVSRSTHEESFVHITLMPPHYRSTSLYIKRASTKVESVFKGTIKWWALHDKQ